METKDIIKTAVELLDSKKASDISAFEVTDLLVITDAFVIASGTSAVHVNSLAADLEDKLAEAGVLPRGVEGKATGWILLDYGTVIIHIFTPDQREYYNLDKLWADAERIDIDEYITD